MKKVLAILILTSLIISSPVRAENDNIDNKKPFSDALLRSVSPSKVERDAEKYARNHKAIAVVITQGYANQMSAERLGKIIQALLRRYNIKSKVFYNPTKGSRNSTVAFNIKDLPTDFYLASKAIKLIVGEDKKGGFIVDLYQGAYPE